MILTYDHDHWYLYLFLMTMSCKDHCLTCLYEVNILTPDLFLQLNICLIVCKLAQHNPPCPHTNLLGNQLSQLWVGGSSYQSHGGPAGGPVQPGHGKREGGRLCVDSDESSTGLVKICSGTITS